MSFSEGHGRPATVAGKQPSPSYSDGEEDIDANPAQHFLSPVHAYEYDDWSDDSDDDSGSVEWDAGITDFALFDHDRRQAQTTGESLPDKWNDLMSNQASALQRSVARSRAWSEVNDMPGNHDHRSGSVPALTPDASPHMDDLDDNEPLKFQQPTLPTFKVSPRTPIYRKVTAAEIEDAMNDFYDDDDDDGLLLSIHPPRKENVAPLQHRRKVQRPGLGKDRTLSGRAHSWRRPGLHLGIVMENPREEREAEREAEREDMISSTPASCATPAPVNVPRHRYHHQIEDDLSNDARWVRRGGVQLSANVLSRSL